MPQYIRNGPCDIDFLSNQGVLEYLEDALSNLTPDLMKLESVSLLFTCLREKSTLKDIAKQTKDLDWCLQPFEIQSIAVGLKLFRQKL